MTTTTLIFDAVQSGSLLLTLTGAISVLLLAWGVRQLTRRRWRYAAVCIGSAAGPLVGVPLAAAALVTRYVRVGRRAEVMAWSGAGAIAAALLIVAVARGSWAEMSCGAWMAVLGVQVALAVGIFYAAVYAYLGPARLAALMALRCAAIVALLMAMFKPAISRIYRPGEADEAGKPYLPIVVDRSASMATRDVGDAPAAGADKPTRYEHALSRIAGRLADADRDFRLVWYHFADGARTADSLEPLRRLRPTGKDTLHTDIRRAIAAVRQNHMPEELAGIVLVSDGVNNPRRGDTDNERLLSAAGRAGAGIFTASVGSREGPVGPRDKNLRIESVVVSPSAVMKNNVAGVKVRLGITGFARAPVKVCLYEAGSDTPIDSKEIWTHKDHAELEAELKWTPRDRPAGDSKSGDSDEADIRRLRVAVSPQLGESRTQDNKASVNALVTQPRIRVLYVEGTIRPEYKPLKSLLDTDPNVQFASLVRISENRFWAYGSLDGRKFTSLPTTDEHFKLFDVLILGDLDRTFLSAAQMRRIRRFVNDGGGFVMLGGQSSFGARGAGGYAGTDIENILPVVVGTAQRQETTPFIPQITAVGAGHPILSGLGGYFIGPGGRKDALLLPQLPKLLGCVTVVRAKPTADVLMVHPSRRNAAGPLIVLAVQQFGLGRSAAFTADTTRLWYMYQRLRGVEGPYERLWGQLVRWLAGADTKSRGAACSILLQLDPSRTVFRPGEAVAVSASVRGAKDAPAAEVTCGLIGSGDDGKTRTLTMKPTQDKKLFRTSFTARMAGKFRLEVTAVDKNKKVLAADRLPVIVTKTGESDQSAETDPANLKPNRKLLARIAEVSGGEHREISQFAELVGLIRSRQTQAADRDGRQIRTVIYPVYSSATMVVLFGVFVVLLTAEWILRRRWQLH